jgi:hypothetical protein
MKCSCGYNHSMFCECWKDDKKKIIELQNELSQEKLKQESYSRQLKIQAEQLAKMTKERDGWKEGCLLEAEKHGKASQENLMWRKVVEKLRDGPGNKMAGWKMTWAHQFADEHLQLNPLMKAEKS